MRATREETARTRTRILGSAATLFRRDGIHATGLAGLMAEAGLTHGGFYSHFESKDHLVAEACEVAFREALEPLAKRAGAAPPNRRLETFVDLYLSEAHRSAPADGCGFAALGSELGRASPETRAVASQAFEHYVATIASFLPDLTPARASRKARAIAATLLGAMTIARAVADADLAREVLVSARESILGADSARPKVQQRRNGGKTPVRKVRSAKS
jgi:TetR/AcrR family transcriptional repressor of nem operon